MKEYQRKLEKTNIISNEEMSKVSVLEAKIATLEKALESALKDEQKYGILLQPSIRLHRQWFREMVKLQGIYVLYRAPLKDKHYTTYAEIDSNFAPPLLIGCLFEQHPDQITTKKLGWVSELQENASIIHVDYDLPHLQQGSIFIIPSGLDDGKARIFRVVKLTNSMVYPASIACEIVPEYIDNFNEATDYAYNPQDEIILYDEEVGPTVMIDDYDLENM